MSVTTDNTPLPKYQLTPEELEFLIGLTELSKRTGVAIGGCGCCGSPSLENISEGNARIVGGYILDYYDGDRLTWIDPTNNKWDHNHEHIIGY